MIRYLKLRKMRKLGREWLNQARHARDLREDIADPQALRQLDQAADRLRLTLARDGVTESAIHQDCNTLADAVRQVDPRRSMSWLRENLEIALVAVAVAMAFRTYFIQPFKIPTGSMQPTLYGIHYKPQTGASMMDRYPLNLVRWLMFGEWYTEYRAQTSGIVSDAYVREDDAATVHVVIGGVAHPLPRAMQDAYRFGPGQRIERGEILAAGVRTLGDHIFVNRVKWNFWPPERGDVMVFTTGGIPEIDQDTHYIKRMVGLPNERIGIDPPYLLVDGTPTMTPAMIRRITEKENGYAGYQLTGADPDDSRFILNTEADRLDLGPDGYAAFGDNTGSSLDSRYWGPVPRDNLVGPAFWVYWPFSKRWGLIH